MPNAGLGGSREAASGLGDSRRTDMILWDRSPRKVFVLVFGAFRAQPRSELGAAGRLHRMCFSLLGAWKCRRSVGKVLLSQSAAFPAAQTLRGRAPPGYPPRRVSGEGKDAVFRDPGSRRPGIRNNNRAGTEALRSHGDQTGGLRYGSEP